MKAFRQKQGGYFMSKHLFGVPIICARDRGILSHHPYSVLPAGSLALVPLSQCQCNTGVICGRLAL